MKCGYDDEWKILAGWKTFIKELLAKVDEDRQIMKIIQQRQHHWTGHILKHQSLLLDIIEGRTKGRHKGE